MSGSTDISGGSDITSFASALLRNAWIILLCIMISIGIGFLYAFYIAETSYRSTAAIVLRQDTTSQVTDTGVAVPTTAEKEAERINTEVAVLRGDSVLRDVATELDLYADPDFNSYLGERGASLTPDERETFGELATISELRDVVTARAEPGTYVIEVGAVATSASKAQAIVRTVIDAYQNRQVAAKEERFRENLQRLSQRLESLQADLIEAEAAIDDFRSGQGGAERQSSNAVRLEQLAAEAQAIRGLYEAALGRYAEANLTEEQYRPDSYILNPASQPMEPFSPRKKLVLLVSVVLGGIAGLSLALFRETVSDVIHDPSALEALIQRPVIGLAPEMKRFKGGRGIRGQFGLDRPRSVAAIETLRSNLASIRRSPDDDPRCIALISSLPDEGKTPLSVALAESYVNAGHRVLLIDTDLRVRTLSDWLVPSASTGLVSALLHGVPLSSAVTEVGGVGFSILPAEMTPENPLNLLSSGHFRRLVEEAKTRYDYVILDTAPVFAVADSRFACAAADLVLYVASQSLTTAHYLREAMFELGNTEAPIDAAVMTNIRPNRFDRARNNVAKRYMWNPSRAGS